MSDNAEREWRFYLDDMIAFAEKVIAYTDGLDQAAESALSIATVAKTFQFQLARSMARKKPLDLQPIDQMAAHWRTIAEQLKARFLS